MGRVTVKVGVTVKSSSRDKILSNNNIIISKVKRRVDHNLKIHTESKNFPLKCDNFESIEMRKDYISEFSKKGKYAYRCTLNALNNCLPRGIYLNYDHMHILRDLKLLHLSKGAVLNMQKNIPEYPPESVVNLYDNIYVPVNSKEPLEYKKSKDNWPLDCVAHLHMLTEPRIQLYNPLKYEPFDVALSSTKFNDNRTKEVMKIMEFYNPCVSKSPSSPTANVCAVWLLQLYTEDDNCRSTTKAKVISDELQKEEETDGVERIGQLHCISIDLRGGISSGLILDDRQNGPLSYNFENMITVQTMPNADKPIGIYNIYGIRPCKETPRTPPTGTSSDFNCIPCAKVFQSAASMASHLTEHKTCTYSGCSFSACRSVLTKHRYTLHKQLSCSSNEDWKQDRIKIFPAIK